MVDKVDDDGSGEIEFKEFKKIVKGDGDSNGPIMNFFRDLFNGKFGDRQQSFPVFVQQMKREAMMNVARPGEVDDNKAYGKKILENMKEYINSKKKTENKKVWA